MLIHKHSSWIPAGILKVQKLSAAFCSNLSQNHEASPAVWYHTVLSATKHK